MQDNTRQPKSRDYAFSIAQCLEPKNYSFIGLEDHLSEAVIDKIVHELAPPVMNEGLKSANENLYNVFTYGISVTEFVNGEKPTIQTIDWGTPESSWFYFTEEIDVDNTNGTTYYTPAIVCFGGLLR